jgi:hypothetical protein
MAYDDSQAVKDEMGRLRAHVVELERDLHDGRVRRAEDYGAFRVQVTAIEARLGAVEDGVRTLMMHSTWLLRILVGGIAVAAVQFALSGGFHVA